MRGVELGVELPDERRVDPQHAPPGAELGSGELLHRSGGRRHGREDSQTIVAAATDCASVRADHAIWSRAARRDYPGAARSSSTPRRKLPLDRRPPPRHAPSSARSWLRRAFWGSESRQARERARAANFDARPECADGAQPPGERGRATRCASGSAASARSRSTGAPARCARSAAWTASSPAASGRDGAVVALDYVREHAAAFGLDAERPRRPAPRRSRVRGRRRAPVVGAAPPRHPDRRRGAAGRGDGQRPAPDVTGPPPPTSPCVDRARRRRSGAYAAARAERRRREPGRGSCAGAAAPSRRPRSATAAARRSRSTARRRGYRLAWRVLAPVSSTGVYDMLVDARSGQPVRRANRVKFAACPPTCSIQPGDRAPGHRGLRPWLTAGDAAEGPNAHVFATRTMSSGRSISGFQLTPEPGSDVGASRRHVRVPLHLSPATACPRIGRLPRYSTDPFPMCRRARGTPGPAANSWAANRQQSATQLFYFVNVFHDHLRKPPGSPSRRAGSASPGQAAREPEQRAPATASDPVLAQALDGANTAAGSLTTTMSTTRTSSRSRTAIPG